MFECTLSQGELFKKIISALSDLVTEGNFMIDTNKISFQGMDSSHVSLVALSLYSQGFEPYRCDRDITLGINFASLNKILKCMTSKDQFSIRANDESDSVFFTFASAEDKRVSNFELKLMDIDSEQLGIPETEYSTIITMPSSEFQRICRDLSAIGDSIVISSAKDGVKFSVSGDIGSGDMILKGRMRRRRKKIKDENNNDNDNDNNNNNNDNNDNDHDNDEKDQVQNKQIKSEQDMDGDETMNTNEDNKKDEIQEQETKGNEKEQKDKDNNKAEEEEEEEEYEYEENADDNDEENKVVIILNETVTQTFALRYLNNFTKATNLSNMVTLSMGSEVPLKVEYAMDNLGFIQYYLAPKIDDEE